MPYSVVLFSFLLIPFTLCSQNLTGYWQGVVYQPSGGTSTYYPSSLNLAQTGNAVSGTYDEQNPNSPYYAILGLTGTVSSNILTCQLSGIIRQNPLPFPNYWCPSANGTWTYDPVAQTLSGPGNSPGCAGALTMQYWRLALVSDSIFCLGEPVQLTVTGQNVKWYTDSTLGTAVYTGNTITPSLGTTTIYYVTQTHFNTESPAAPIRIIINKPVSIQLNASICEGDSYLGYTKSGTYVNRYTAANGCDSVQTINLVVKTKMYTTIDQITCDTPFQGYSKSGSYVDVYTGTNGCDSIRTLNLTVKHRSTAAITEVVCEGQSYLGHNQSGTYSDTLTAANGCDSILTLSLTLIPSAKSRLDSIVCAGQIVFGHDKAGTYTDTLQAANGCDSFRTLVLTINSLPHPDLATDSTICIGSTVVLNPGVFDSYLWQDSSTNSTFSVSQPGNYSVMVTNRCGSAISRINITTTDCLIRFPGAFTPNGDGHNDFFRVINGFLITDYHLIVFNRSGTKVFETVNPATGWDGTLQGKLESAGTYVWFCSFTSHNNPRGEKRQGTVILVR